MPVSVTIEVDLKGKIIKGTAFKAFDEASVDAFREGGLFLEGEVARRTPINLGLLRKSISHDVRGSALARYGRIFSALEYAKPVEEGQRPHWPPYQPIFQWVVRKKRESGLRAKRAAFAVMRKIAGEARRRPGGTRPVEMFKKTFKDARAIATLGRIFRSHMAKFVARL